MKKLMIAAIAALAMMTTVPAMALNSDCVNRVVTIHNDSSQVLETFRLSGRDASHWSGNYLSEFDVYPGQSFTVDGDYAPGAGSGYHVFYFDATSYEGGHWSDSFDMCTVTDWTLVD